MTSDLIFSVLPREGKVAIEKEELKVKKIEKEAKLRALNEEESDLSAEERDAREKYHKKSSSDNAEKEKKEKADNKAKQQSKEKEPVDPELPSVDEQGRKHLDIYI
ncbi:hypothetical protein [Aliiglaciecola lipolytica]|uniref:Uncharacterized protein n=1 Tax=Aliiglaciecola lipolytica E3 TaxID=1127673 RepID=K6YBU4_9ALTE|nr:hypothetical protein [Aliiglaciecola lipolytica]GAC14118.1 hypothetical protein GLIP_1483 [Aliiglaciecola lipolytica E3]